MKQLVLPTKRWLEASTATALLLMFRLWNPPDEPSIRFCGFYWLTNLPCPLCGITRGLCAAAKGDLAKAISFHALSPALLAVIVVWLITSLTNTNLAPSWWRTASLSVLGAYGALRIVLA